MDRPAPSARRMPDIKLVRGARQLLTLRGAIGPRRGTDLNNLAIIPNGAVLIVDGRIHDIGPASRVESLALSRHAREIDASGRLVLPGFADCHTHIASGPVCPVSPLGPVPALARSIQGLSPRTLQAYAARTMERALSHGTTTLESKSGCGLTEANEIKTLNIHSKLAKLLPDSVVSTFACSTSDRICSHILPLIKRRALADFFEIISSENFAAEDMQSVFHAALTHGFRIKLQLAPGYDSTALRRAIQSGAQSIDDAVHLTARDTAALASSQTIAVLLAGPLLHASIQTPSIARTLIDSGAAIALASGFHPVASPSESMPAMIALACARLSLTPEEAIAASTINAAFALGRASRIGSLEAGKNADLLVLNISDYRELTCHLGVNLVDLVMKNGAIVSEKSQVHWPQNALTLAQD